MTAPQISAARLLGTFVPGTAEWDRARSGLVITATEVAAVVGLSPWRTRSSLWHRKAGAAPAKTVTSPAAMKWGTRLEPVIADVFAEAHPDLAVHATGTWANRDRGWQRATPDRIITPADGGPAALLEIKTSRHEDDWVDGVPVYYRCQVLWQLDTLGLDVAHVAVLVAGQDYREYTVPYDAAEAEALREAASEFLRSIAAGEPPPSDEPPAASPGERHLPDPVGDVDIAPDLAEAYRSAVLASQRAAARKTDLAAAVLAVMGDARHCRAAGQTVATRSVRPDGTTRSLIPNRTYMKAS
ncbi:YqaJ viral recombinase family protein [Streptomyces sp. SCA3-4]|uniref:YqaJ viral recombinase family nuclease n=1 Tax=Streptomyces sichuanensis TaxID=2871810 RepID=UPI001CE2CE6D|nr:YqaJ viral recombinase family protein [Streptomyces sichuanensis]MCA6090967.1 YqaJ viral recombinase family protein [Streptomyces sichuanensis]